MRRVLPAMTAVTAAFAAVALSACSGDTPEHRGGDAAPAGRASKRSASPSASQPAPGTHSTTPGASGSATPVLVTPAAGDGKQYVGRRPSVVAFSVDGGNIVSQIDWTTWGATGAEGRGSSIKKSCVPSCAEASPTPVSTTITLSDPVGGTFTTMVEHRSGENAVTYRYGTSSWQMHASGGSKA